MAEKEILSDNQFKYKLETGQFLFSDEFEVNEQIYYSGHSFKASYLFIKNGTFKMDFWFEGINFKGTIEFHNCTFKQNLRFTNCIFEAENQNPDNTRHNIILKDCTIDAWLYFFAQNTLNTGIYIEGGKINCLFTDSTQQITIPNGSFKLKKVTIQKLKLENINIPNGDLTLDEVKVEEDVEISNIILSDTTGSLKINEKSKITGKTRITDVKGDSIVINKSTFESDIHIRTKGLKFGLISTETEYQKDMNIAFFDGDIRLIGVKFKKSLKVDLQDCNLNHLHIQQVEFGTTLSIKGKGKENKIKSLDIQCSLDNIGTIAPDKCTIDKANITGDNHKANLLFKEVNFKELNILNFTNYGNLTLDNCKGLEDSTFQIINSDLGKAKLFDINFKSFRKIEIKNVYILDITYSNVTWFDDLQFDKVKDLQNSLKKLQNQLRNLEYDFECLQNQQALLLIREDLIDNLEFFNSKKNYEQDNEEYQNHNKLYLEDKGTYFLEKDMYLGTTHKNFKKEPLDLEVEKDCLKEESKCLKNQPKHYQNKREVYRQLKQLTDKQGDRIQSLDFQAEEFKAYKKLLQQTKSWWHKDRWILRLSQTNNFGLNWSKPFWWILGLTIVFYPLMVIEASPKLDWIPATSYKDVKNTCDELIKYLNIIPQLFNPTRSLDKLFPKIENLSFCVHLLDILQRLALAFFSVQIVSAFRKYVK
jgi:hypothetical protein